MRCVCVTLTSIVTRRKKQCQECTPQLWTLLLSSSRDNWAQECQESHKHNTHYYTITWDHQWPLFRRIVWTGKICSWIVATCRIVPTASVTLNEGILLGSFFTVLWSWRYLVSHYFHCTVSFILIQNSHTFPPLERLASFGREVSESVSGLALEK